VQRRETEKGHLPFDRSNLLQGNSLIDPAQRRVKREHENIGCETTLRSLWPAFPRKSFWRIRKLAMSCTKILIVDDFPPWQQFIFEMFKSETDSNIIYFAADGLEAVQKAQELQPDVILMDVSLPVMNGFEATGKIRVLSPGSKILFLTERRSYDYMQGAFDAGASGYILKTDAGSDLLRGVEAALQNQRFVSRSLKDWRKGSDGG
jgi:CheY-like chemotaxis protein